MPDFASTYSSAKIWINEQLGATEDLLHIHAGLIIFFIAAMAFRARMGSLVPIALVYLFAVGNEAIDTLSPGSASSRWEPVVDVLNTVLWPTLLFFLARRRGRDDNRYKTV